MAFLLGMLAYVALGFLVLIGGLSAAFGPPSWFVGP